MDGLIENLLILHFIDYHFGCILTRLKLNFAGYLTFELTVWGLKLDDFGVIYDANFDRLLSSGDVLSRFWMCNDEIPKISFTLLSSHLIAKRLE